MKAIATLNGSIIVHELPEPELKPGHVLVRTEYSAISPGTEMTAVRNHSKVPAVLGYSAVGVVERVGEGVKDRYVGERVACYGAPYVKHAEIMSVPSNLTAPVPDHVSSEEAAFAGLGAIGVHALRTANLSFGESAVVVGLGILGNIIAQISNAAAYRTAALDLDKTRVEAVKQLGLAYAYDTPELLEEQMPLAIGPTGADAVLICAAGPGEPLINRAIDWLRDRGKIVIVGDITAEFSRAKMFGKEVQVLISRAGGPGRYDAQYEMDNRDYPIGYVRWTEGRNIGEYIRLLAGGRISVSSLITHVYPLEQAADAYRNYAERKPSTVGTLIKF